MAQGGVRSLGDPVEHRAGQAEGRRKKIERPEAARADVGVLKWDRPLVVGQQNEPHRGLREIPQDRQNISVGEMEEAVAAEPKIGRWELVACEVEVHEPRALAAVRCLVGLDECRDDVAADVVDGVGGDDQPHPVEITAGGVEERAHGLLLEHQRQVLPKGGGVVEGGAGSADALGVIPDVQTVDHLENYLGIGRTVQPPPIIALPPGPDLAAGREHAFARGGGEAVALKRVA